MNLEIRDSLIAKMGKESVTDDEEVLAEFAQDITENPAGKPDLVVYAKSAENVRSVLTEANRLSVPVTCVMANTNLGGLAVPQKGGIILNLTKMNKILEVNEEDLYAIIEPGVTWQDISDYLDQNHPGLRFAYPLSPPDSGIVPNCIMDGLANYSLRTSSASAWINAIEAILPSGETLQTGHMAYGSSTPCTNAPFPALHGLFVGFQGSTGVVTKMSVQLWPKKKYVQRLFILAYDVEHAYGLAKQLAKEDIVDDIGTLSGATGKMLFGEYRPTYQDPNEPILFVYIDFSSNYENDFACKKEIIADLVGQWRAKGAKFDGPLDLEDLVRLEPKFAKFAKFPTRLDFLLDHPGGGLTWVGTYGPTSRFEEGYKKGAEILAKYGLPPVVVCRPMQGSHFGVLRWITVFDRNDEKDVEKVRAVNRDLADMAVELGFFPYKTPQWAWDRYADRINPTFRRLVRDVRKLMDPKGILNPGHLDL
ncbi:MAG: FAD-binding oxidoreductase [Deltaproteobacteria bacterium]|nr:FAD-binding oxidoreductase [Deltaproteobacteria bacterium]MBW1872924.1 FAD-binding oxidoreductase [Deltaproteobacteria bacterium]